VRSGLPTVLVVLAAFGLAACGGSGDSVGDEVREAAVLAGKSEDPDEFCRQLVTERFVDEVFEGDLDACLESDVVGGDPGKPIVTAVVNPDGDDSQATVAMRFEGGDADGVRGHLSFVDEEGEWRLDRFESDYLRSVFTVSLKAVDEGVLADPAVQDCMAKRLERQDEQFIRTVMFLSLRDQKESETMTIGLVEECPGQVAGWVADETLAAYTQSGLDDPAFLRCARRELEALLPLLDLGSDVIEADPEPASEAALEGVTLGVQENCEGG